jgi:hypothetical protein
MFLEANIDNRSKNHHGILVTRLFSLPNRWVANYDHNKRINRRGCIHNTSSFSQLTNGPTKLDFLSLTILYSLV